MPTPKPPINNLSCPKCDTEVVIYKGWATFKDDKIKIQNGAKWRCPNCRKMGRLGEEDKN